MKELRDARLAERERRGGKDKYLVYQVWRGGFNNDRMSLELALVWAMLTGRVLVLPPHYHLYLLDHSGIEVIKINLLHVQT